MTEKIPIDGGAHGASMLPRHHHGKYLYLDFDGVLHHEDYRRKLGVKLGFTYAKYYFGDKAMSDRASNKIFEHADILVEALAPYPDVKIILSSSWVRVRGYAKARAGLPEALKSRVVGGTYHSMNEFPAEFKDASRGMQVWSDVSRRSPRAWLAIDDDDFGWPKWALNNLVRSNEIHGISSPDVLLDLKEKLKLHFG